MNYLEAAIRILEEFGRPLGYKEIAAIALERDWIEPQKPDSGSVMNSLIMQDLKMKGMASDFSRIGPGTFTLRKLIYQPASEPEKKAPASRAARRPTEGRRRESAKSPSPRLTPEKGAAAAPPRGEAMATAHKELWKQLERVGSLLGFRALPLRLTDEPAPCLTWHLHGNPELAFTIWVTEGADMQKVTLYLLALNFHKVVVIAGESDAGAVRVFAENHAERDRLEIVALDQLADWAAQGTQFLEIGQRLRDCRPYRERQGFLMEKALPTED
ncbi:MAG: winged helix-turn-helix domain-containing protein [Acidobacteria bacterium]|nr:winged helix-turn-helix domain-containing protein [Acidobacteriota bacterium]